MIGVSGLLSAALSAVLSKTAAWIIAAGALHLVTVKARVHAAEEKVKADLKAKFDEVAEYVKTEAEQDVEVVKTTLARYEADIRKIF